MEVTIFAGKGGVGKSTSAAAYSVSKAQHEKVLVVDYDGGHSLTRVLSIDKVSDPNKIISTGIDNLDIALVEPIKFDNIIKSQMEGVPVEEYLDQFKGDYGIIPLCDMVTSFFGAPTDIDSLSRFTSIIDLYHQAKDCEIQRLVIDVEPTAGLERMLSSSNSVRRSIMNLQNMGVVSLNILGTKWPDVKSFIRGNYIGKANFYASRISNTHLSLMEADYFVVCVPESSPVEEMEDVKKVIESNRGSIKGYVINNIRGELHEEEQIRKVQDVAVDLPVFTINHDRRLCYSDNDSRLNALKEIGNLFEK